MWLTDVSIRRPVFIVMFVLALIVLGFQSRSRMPAELTPKVDIPYVSIVTIYPGAGPSEIETLVTEPIEKAVGAVANLKNVTSSSQDGVSAVVLEFELGTDLDAATADVRDKVGAIKGELPDDAEEPSISKADISADPVITVGLSGPISPKEMRIVADEVVEDRLAKCKGVASTNVSGGEEREILVAVDKDRLDAYGIGLGSVVAAVKSANLNVPAGSIKEGARDYSVRTVGEFSSVDQIAALEIPLGAQNAAPPETLRVSDIARIEDTVAESDIITRINGKPGVAIDVFKQSDANTVEVAEAVKEELTHITSELPSGVETFIINDESVFVEDSLHDVNKSLFEGILIVVVVIFLFLRTGRATFVVALAIPTSIMATYTPIYASGFTLNMMTLLALSLVVGILVDDSIVVLENIERHLRMRKQPRQAALDGRSEIGLAAVTITMVDVVVFVPIAFMGGIVGQFFRQFGVTVATATLFSLLMSFTLTPMLASRWMKSEEDKEREREELNNRLSSGTAGTWDRFVVIQNRVFGATERFLDMLDRNYRGLLEWALENRYLTVVIGFVSLLVVFALAMPELKMGQAVAGSPRVVIALIALGLSMTALHRSRSKKVALTFGLLMAGLALFIHLPFGFEFIPVTDSGDFVMTLRTPPGTSLKGSDEVAREVEAILAQVPELKGGYFRTTVGSAGVGGMFGSEIGPQYIRIDGKCIDKLQRERGISEIVDDIADRAAAVPGAEFVSVSAGGGDGPGNIIQMEVQGRNMDSIIETANRLAGVMSEIDGTANVDISWKESRPERRIIVDRTRAAEYQISVAEVGMAARMAIDGDDSAKFRDEGTEYPIRVQYDESMRDKASDVENLIVGGVDGAPIYLRDVAQVKYDNAPTKIDRKNRRRVVYVSANVATGARLGNVQNQINQALKKMPKTPGTSIRTGGSGEMMAESFGYMFEALILAIVLVYMLMGALFESFLTPFVIMFSLPQAMVGAILALLVTGKSLSIVSMIGIIMLMGLVAKNAILLVDYTNTLRSRGRTRDQAVLEAGPTRLRPILMTTLSMIGGVMPTALALSRGAEMRAPMAIAVIGGLLFSMLLTLVVIPVVYTIVDDAWMGFLRRFFPAAYRRSRTKEQEAGEEETEAFPGILDPDG